jgi:programmed cell death 6-interacting protein
MHSVGPQFKRGQFYNDMTNLLTRFKEACRMWSNARSQEAQ